MPVRTGREFSVGYRQQPESESGIGKVLLHGSPAGTIGACAMDVDVSKGFNMTKVVSTPTKRVAQGDPRQVVSLADVTSGSAVVLRASPPTCVFPIQPARSGDLIDIHTFLASVFQGPSAAEFQAQQEMPAAEPQQRLIVRTRTEVVGHVRVTPPRIMQIGEATIPVCWLLDWAIAPHIRRQGVGSELIASAEQLARSKGASLLLARSQSVNLLRKQGWSLCGQHSYSLVDAFRLLAYLEERKLDQSRNQRMNTILHGKPETWTVRPLRMLDLPELERLEQQRVAQQHGSLHRSRDFWEWLLSRRAFDSFYVIQFPNNEARLAGYAIARSSRIVELVIDSQADTAVHALLGRLAQDTIEEGSSHLRLDAAPDDPYHQIFRAAQGRSVRQDFAHGEAYCLKVLSPLQLLTQLSPIWQSRWASLPKPRPDSLTFAIEDHASLASPYYLSLHFKTGTVTTDTPASTKGHLQIGRSEFDQLVLGQFITGDEHSQFLQNNPESTISYAKALFPTQTLYYPTFDHLTAR